MDVLHTIPTLHQLCREYIATIMWRHNQFTPCQLPLPSREINALDATRPSLLPVRQLFGKYSKKINDLG